MTMPLGTGRTHLIFGSHLEYNFYPGLSGCTGITVKAFDDRGGAAFCIGCHAPSIQQQPTTDVDRRVYEFMSKKNEEQILELIEKAHESGAFPVSPHHTSDFLPKLVHAAAERLKIEPGKTRLHLIVQRGETQAAETRAALDEIFEALKQQGYQVTRDDR